MRAALPAAILMTLTLLCLPAPAQAQWKWKDSGGQVHVSDLPPPRGTPDKDILSRPDPVVRRPAAPVAAASGPARPASGAARSDPELEARRKKAEADAAQRGKAEETKLAEQKAENCRRAREQMATLDSGVRIARVNAKGEREVLDDAGRAAEVQRARQVISQDCR
ncbi:MAG: DUF4124 domain-containing protein [Aquabacterium sp.]